MTDVCVPAIEDASQIFIARWLKNVGDHVAVGEPIAELITDKANVEVVAPAPGTLVELSFSEEARVSAGQVIARIEADS